MIPNRSLATPCVIRDKNTRNFLGADAGAFRARPGALVLLGVGKMMSADVALFGDERFGATDAVATAGPATRHGINMHQLARLIEGVADVVVIVWKFAKCHTVTRPERKPALSKWPNNWICEIRGWVSDSRQRQIFLSEKMLIKYRRSFGQALVVSAADRAAV